MRAILITGEDTEEAKWEPVIRKRLEDIGPVLVVARYSDHGVSKAARDVITGLGSEHVERAQFFPYPRSVNGMAILVNQMVSALLNLHLSGHVASVEIFSDDAEANIDKCAASVLMRLTTTKFVKLAIYITRSDGTTTKLSESREESDVV